MNEGTGQAARGAPSSGDTDTNELGKRRSMRLRGAASTDSSVVSLHDSGADGRR